ncbi:protein hipA [Escherichia coli]|nr:protein hipA [Escherichia coli]
MPKLVTWMNNQRVGELTKLANGAHTFKYAPEWLASRYARPLSLSLPLQRGNITSDAVFNFFDNLLPDSPIVRDRIVKRYHAKSRQPFDLLSEIGRDSVGAVTLIPEDETVTHPTTHIIKLPIGEIRQPNATLDLSQSVDNEYYCLLLAKELGLNVPDAEIIKAGNVRALAVERFDRRWNAERTVLLRLPQEDMCQTFGLPSSVKYESDGGPGIARIMAFLMGSSEALNLFRLAAVIDSRHFTTSFQHFRSLAVREYTSAISNWQWGLTHPKAKKRQSIKFIRDIFWRQQRC